MATERMAAEGQRREYSRVEAYIPFEYRVIADDEKEHVHARISADTTNFDIKPVQDIANHDHILSEWFKIINVKLDTIIRFITLQREGFFGLPFKAVNISGGGISFLLSQNIPLGEVLEIKLMLTWNQPIAITIYGRVTKSDKGCDGYHTAIRYYHMDDSVRDEIIRFVFEKEREIIRKKRG
jgi:c-di-GMP-binding flagellar brake protein YcgR